MACCDDVLGRRYFICNDWNIFRGGTILKRLIHFPYKRVLVLGLAKSGSAAAELLLRSGIQVRVNDKYTKETATVVTRLRQMGAEVIVGSHPKSVLQNIELIVKNPGIPYEHPLIQMALVNDVNIITEIELAYQLAKDKQIIGITGSNGKTTTTNLIYEMFVASDRRVKLAGNIGIVATEVAQQLADDERLLLELSSFQLMGTETFRPNIACLLNLYGAHLDYHGTVEAYEQAKARLFMNQEKTDVLVFNLDDSRVVKLVEQAKAHLVPFSTKKRLDHSGAWTDETYLYFKSEKIIALNEVVLVGSHNIENML